MFNGFVGRIPIYDRRLNLFAYDLKVCGIESSSRGTETENTREPADNAVIRASEEIVLADLVGRICGFLDVPDTLLNRVGDLCWPKEQVILRISAMARSKDRSEYIRDLSNAGYKIAIEGNSQTFDALQDARFASVCSIDVARNLPGAGTFISRLHGQGVKLFARNIGSPAQYEQLQTLGFDLFQGKYFEQPKSVKHSFIAANKSAVLELLARFNDPELTIQEVETLITKDVTLSYKLLRLINTAYFGIPKRIESIRRAVVFFGLERIKNWASVIVFNAIEYQPNELMTTALVRARTCEILAEKLGRQRIESYFVSGLFSTLDAIIDLPMPVIVEQLRLSEEICAALLDGSGPIGELLTGFLAIENGACCRTFSRLLTNGLAMDAYTHAIRWVNALNHAIAD
ncbi:MAG: EAL and HDOD domain-containing protein [Methylococcales bacterium]